MNEHSEKEDAASRPAFVMNGDGIVVGWTPEAAAIFGWSAHEATGRSLSELIIKPSDRPSHEAGLKHFMAGADGKFLDRPLELSVVDREGHAIRVAFRIGVEKTTSGTRFPTTARKLDS